ncbi:voltage-dependent anion channel-domain-containing protein [Massariosphaeria phaeospora]|uniref:Voltage-dependent anion channel-domain-containing protein n=1 Tax=Massariosphaeria phaeospora TaxID=100035 RepID=A0A7C8ML00_9PLEO|nr:voltage-dependent anion channel-domain-containing protein [Massariosphaeria phaeospora]
MNQNQSGHRLQPPAPNAAPNTGSSAAERLQWRNHPPAETPSQEMSDPFQHNGLQLDKTKTEDPATSASDENDGGGEEGGNGTGVDGDEEQKCKLSWRDRIRHFTWTWFTMTMATGGIANVLYTVPFRFRGLYALGCIFFILNIVLFIFNVAMISLRFYFYPRTFRSSFLHPTESLFIPAAVISFGTILINISQYGVEFTGEWLQHTMEVMYWVYCALAFAFSIGIYLIMWSTQTFTISQMTPVWIFPAYPLLIIGPHAGNLAPKITSPNHALLILISGFTFQGIGFLVSLMIYSAFLYRLMTQKLPKESLRPGMFISVGPSGFTVAGIVTMSHQISAVAPPDFMGPGMGPLVGDVSVILANWTGLWLWGLALWFFCVSVGAHWSCVATTRGKMDFAMTWYSFVFPNTALTTATFAIGKALGANRPIQYVGCAMAVALVVTWCFVVGMMVRAVLLRQILWPQKQEDRSEGGWKQPSCEEQGLRQMWSLRGSVSRRSRAARNGAGEGGRKRRWSFARRESGGV